MCISNLFAYEKEQRNGIRAVLMLAEDMTFFREIIHTKINKPYGANMTSRVTFSISKTERLTELAHGWA